MPFSSSTHSSFPHSSVTESLIVNIFTHAPNHPLLTCPQYNTITSCLLSQPVRYILCYLFFDSFSFPEIGKNQSFELQLSDSNLLYLLTNSTYPYFSAHFTSDPDFEVDIFGGHQHLQIASQSVTREGRGRGMEAGRLGKNKTG